MGGLNFTKKNLADRADPRWQYTKGQDLKSSKEHFSNGKKITSLTIFPAQVLFFSITTIIILIFKNIRFSKIISSPFFLFFAVIDATFPRGVWFVAFTYGSNFKSQHPTKTSNLVGCYIHLHLTNVTQSQKYLV